MVAAASLDLRPFVREARCMAHATAAETRSDRDSLESAATWGVFRATREFDPSRGVPFAAYLRWVVTREIAGEMRRLPYTQRSGVRARFSPIEFHRGAIEDPGADFVGALEVRDLVERLLSRLGPRHRSLVEAMYLDPSRPGLQAVAARFGVRLSRLYQLRDEAFLAMRRGVKSCPDI